MGVAGQLQVNRQFLGRRKVGVGNPIGGKVAIEPVALLRADVRRGVKKQDARFAAGDLRPCFFQTFNPGSALYPGITDADDLQPERVQF